MVAEETTWSETLYFSPVLQVRGLEEDDLVERCEDRGCYPAACVDIPEYLWISELCLVEIDHWIARVLCERVPAIRGVSDFLRLGRSDVVIQGIHRHHSVFSRYRSIEESGGIVPINDTRTREDPEALIRW